MKQFVVKNWRTMRLEIDSLRELTPDGLISPGNIEDVINIVASKHYVDGYEFSNLISAKNEAFFVFKKIKI